MPTYFSLALLLPLICVSVTATAQVPFKHVILDPTSTAPEKPYGKAIADISGDGKADAFACSDSRGGTFWYDYPHWSKHAIRVSGSWSEDVQLADIDADGDVDVICSNRSGLVYYRNPLPNGSQDWIAGKKSELDLTEQTCMIWKSVISTMTGI